MSKRFILAARVISRSIGSRARFHAHKGLCYIAVFLVIVILAIAGGAALAQTGGPYDLTWHTFDGGGGTTSGGPYALSGTIGQPDAQVMTGGPYTLQGGFWGGSASGIVVYTPLVLRNAG